MTIAVGMMRLRSCAIDPGTVQRRSVLDVSLAPAPVGSRSRLLRRHAGDDVVRNELGDTEGRERPPGPWAGATCGATLRTKQGGRSRPDSSFDADTWPRFRGGKERRPSDVRDGGKSPRFSCLAARGGGVDELKDGIAACSGRLHRGEP